MLWQAGEPNLTWKERAETVTILYYCASESRWRLYDGSASRRTAGRQYGFVIEYD